MLIDRRPRLLPARGFTLVEAMVVVAILAILMAVAAPSYQVFIQNQQIRTATEGLQAGLALARNEALRRNDRVTLWLVSSTAAACTRSAGGTAWVVSLDNPAGSCAATASETAAPRLIQSRAASEGGANVNVSALDGGGTAASCITFNGFGRVETACTGGGAPVARVSFVSAVSPTGTRDLELRITSGGAVRMCDPDVTDTTKPSAC